MNNLMAQVNKMKKDIEKKQKEICETVFEGESEWVTVQITGDKHIKKITIKNRNLKDEEDFECLEDMIKLALTDAFNKIEKETEKKLGMYSSALGGLF